MVIDGRNVTGQFVADDFSRIFSDDAATRRGGGVMRIGGGGGGVSRLGVYYGEKRMTYSTWTPDPTWNGRTLSCVAAQEGFPDMMASANVTVYCESWNAFSN